MSEDFKNVQDMLEQAKELVKTLENKYNELKDKPKNVRWRAKKDFCYYRLRGDGEIEWVPDIRTHEDRGYYNLGNYFKTAQEAEKSYNNIIITQKLKDIALRLNNGVEINCNDYCYLLRPKYKIVLKPYEHKLIQAISTSTIDLGQIYCLSDKFLETAIKEIGEKELIEYIKGC